VSRFHLSILLGSLLASSAAADIVGFQEHFDSDAAEWRNSNGAAVLDWFAAGGPDGSGYASSLFNLSGTSVGGFPPTVIRGQSNFGSSAGAYVGDWIAAGVTGISFDIRHNLAEALTITGRFATPVNNPGASVVSSTVIASNQWTTVTFDLTLGSADFISFGGSDYNTIFSNIGNIQIGFNVPTSLAGQNIDARFDIDNVHIVPAPASMLLLSLGLVARRRR
jgi:hypothetical protein